MNTSTDHSDNKNGQGYNIIVNGRPKFTMRDELSFEEIVLLAFDPPPYGANTLFTITFKRGHGSKPEGTLVKGSSVKIKDGMVFNVTATDKS